VIIDYKLLFFGPSGVAGAVAEEGKSFHGVLHKMTKDDKKKLDIIEMGYDADPCKVRLYDGSEKDAVIYVLNWEKVKNYFPGGKPEDKPPTERYITIIIEGCEHYGVNQEYIDLLKSHEFQERNSPSTFEKFPVLEGTPTMTITDVELGDGIDDNPVYTTCNGKVLKHEGLPSHHLERIQSSKSKGIHSYEVILNTVLYDPLFGIIKTQDDVSKLCAASTEDQLVKRGENRAAAPKTTLVGLIDLQYKD